MQVDCGATCNVISTKQLRKCFKNPYSKLTNHTKISLKMYNEQVIQSIGNVNLKCERNGSKFHINFVVVTEDLQTILGCKTSQECGFI